MSNPETVFRVVGGGVTLELSGSGPFVERHLERFRPFLKDAIGFAYPTETSGTSRAAAPVASSATPAGDFAGYIASRNVREGKGGIQDRLLLAFWFLQQNEHLEEAGTEDITWCFRKAGWELPKSLHNHLGTLKRQKGLLDEGSRRGAYRLSSRGARIAGVRWR